MITRESKMKDEMKDEKLKMHLLVAFFLHEKPFRLVPPGFATKVDTQNPGLC